MLALPALALPAAAQPDPDALLSAWARAQAAVGGVVVLDETLVRRVEGPRGAVRVETESTVRLEAGARPRRTVGHALLDGERISAERAEDFGRRMGRAFGPGGREVAGAPAAAVFFLRRARATGIAADRLDGDRVWRVDLRPPPPRGDRPRRGRRGDRRRPPADRFTAWFSADGARLLGLRVEGRRRGGRIAREVRYQRVDGLDVPRTASAEAMLRQRRRLRDYAVELSSEATYTVAR